MSRKPHNKVAWIVALMAATGVWAAEKLALDPQYVVIGGGLMDPSSTTDAFRERYLATLRAAAEPYLWPAQRARMSVVPATLDGLSESTPLVAVA